MNQDCCREEGVRKLNLFAQVEAGHLLTASLISAPAALAFAKVLYPETEEFFATNEDVLPAKG